jgi:AcrR family transcriptional regulator
MDASANPRKELVREQLVTAAAEVFATKGVAAASMADIASALGLGRSAIYHYFRNKEDILRALIEQETERPYVALAALARRTDMPPEERLRQAVIEAVMRRLSHGARLGVLFQLETDVPSDVSKLWIESRRHIFDAYVGMIEDGMANGTFRRTDAKLAAFAVFGMINWTARWYKPDGRSSPETIADFIAGFALAALRSGALPTPPASVGEGIDRLRADLDTLEKLARR